MLSKSVDTSESYRRAERLIKSLQKLRAFGHATKDIRIIELAFPVMDLDDRSAPHLARRVLNHYLQETGDHDGLKQLRFYQVYRVIVKAKVYAIRLSQALLSRAENRALKHVYQSYITPATKYVIFLCVEEHCKPKKTLSFC